MGLLGPGMGGGWWLGLLCPGRALGCRNPGSEGSARGCCFRPLGGSELEAHEKPASGFLSRVFKGPEVSFPDCCQGCRWAQTA